jgi:hypothetical protein
MAFESVPPVLADISRLLVQVEKTQDPAERAAAVKQLWDIYAKIKHELLEIEKDIRAGENRRVEAVAFRSALSTLALELALMGEEEPGPAP